MKKQDVVDLVKYHVDGDSVSFNNKVYSIAKDFDNAGDIEIAQYLLALLHDVNILKPQNYDYSNFSFLSKDKKECNPLLLPDDVATDVISIVKSISKKNGLHRFILNGQPGTGKTEACRHIARLSNRDLLIVNCEELIDSHLGQTAKNIIQMFLEINKVIAENVIILFDEIDSIFLDRINSNDLREMGRATSTFIKQLDLLSDDIVVLSTTNLYKSLDKALLRRLGAPISFDRYSLDDVYRIADNYISECSKDFPFIRRDSRFLKKIIALCHPLPNPGELKNFIKLSISFSDGTPYGYLKKLFINLIPNIVLDDLKKLSDLGFTLKEIELLTTVSKSSVSRLLNKRR